MLPKIEPLISIITVVYNGEKLLSKCIESVANQSYKNIEHIIIDGGSTDDSVTIIKENQQHIAWWVSQKDEGIYDAMNKGIGVAKGEWLYFLGSDDCLFSKKTIETIMSCLVENNEAKLIYGNVKSSGGRLIKSKYTRKLLLHNTLHHQSCFYNKNIFNNFNYDKKLKIIADYELNLACYLANAKAVKVEIIVALCGDDGASTASINHEIFIKETNAVRKRNLGMLMNAPFQLAFEIKARVHNAFRYI